MGGLGLECDTFMILLYWIQICFRRTYLTLCDVGPVCALIELSTTRTQCCVGPASVPI